MDRMDMVTNAIDRHRKEKRYLYCVLSEISGLDYHQCKQMLYECKLLGLIECDSNFYSGALKV